MQGEQDWLNADVALKEPYAYFMRTDPDMREFLGPIETVHDELTGRDIKRRAAKVAMQRGSDALKDVEVYLEPFPHIRIEKAKDLQGWYSSRNDGLLQGQRDRPCETDAILTQPYGGWCNVGCTFCYINSGSRGYRGSGLITVPIGYGRHVRKQLASMNVSAAGYFSSFTDPFLALEELYHNTQEGAQAFVDAGLPIFFLSRMRYPDWAIDMLRKNKFSYAQKSINTPDPEVWRKISPGALGLEEHFEDLKRIHDAGIYISIQCNPIIPGIVSHDDVEELFGKLAACGVDHVIVKFVESNFPWAKALADRITAKFPDGGVPGKSAAFRGLFTENSCGGQKTITEEYRREGHTRYQRAATSLGMTYSTCYEYTRPPGEGWRSIGPEFLTADQCHGHAVPMFAKKPGDTLFTAIDACEPTGCLRCASQGCGSELLSSASALRIQDMRRPYDGK